MRRAPVVARGRRGGARRCPPPRGRMRRSSAPCRRRACSSTRRRSRSSLVYSRGGRAAVRDRARSPTRTRTADGGPAHAVPPTNPDELDVPLQHLREGWYLVFWRVISVDGHPVRGAFTFAVGPNPGPAPQFVIPLALRDRRDPGARDRTLDRVSLADGGDRALRPPHRDRAAAARRRRARSPVAFWVALGVALVAVPGLRAARDGGVRRCARSGRSAPSCRSCASSAFGRGYLDLELLLALFALAAAIALWLDRPERTRRSRRGAARARAARCSRPAPSLLVPGAAGHAAQTRRARSRSRSTGCTSRRRLALARRPHRPARALAEPARERAASPASPSACRASRTSRSSRCMVLLGSGDLGVRAPPADARVALADVVRQDDHRQGVAPRVRDRSSASGNLLPHDARARAGPSRPLSAAILLRRLVSVEVLLVAAAVAAAAVLSSLAAAAEGARGDRQRERARRARAR